MRLIILRETALRIAGILSLVGLAFMMWPILQPKPFAIIVGMSIGEGFGALGILVFLAIVIFDVRKAHVLDRDEIPPGQQAPNS